MHGHTRFHVFTNSNIGPKVKCTVCLVIALPVIQEPAINRILFVEEQLGWKSAMMLLESVMCMCSELHCENIDLILFVLYTIAVKPTYFMKNQNLRKSSWGGSPLIDVLLQRICCILVYCIVLHYIVL